MCVCTGPSAAGCSFHAHLAFNRTRNGDFRGALVVCSVAGSETNSSVLNKC